jgi:hypothetical protein
MVIFFLLLLFLNVTQVAFAAPVQRHEKTEHFSNEIFADKIHTVLVRSTTWELSSPVYELGSNQRLELIFDDLSNNPRTFGYTLVHCDADWNRSDLQTQEYLSGLGEGTIRESDPSYNTTYDFIHYRLEFPEEDCVPLLSGNYALVVYEADNRDQVILTQRIYVVEKTVQLTGQVHQAPQGDFRETGQQVSFTLSYANLYIQDPVRDLEVIIRQNGRDDNCIKNPKPAAISPGEIDFTSADEGIFMAGNEFRTLDIKSMKYQTENIASIDFQNPYYHVYLKPDKSRENKPYFSKADLNGRYFINQEKARNKHLEADYVFVHFSLEQPYPLPEEVYVTGKLTDWKLTPSCQMKYNEEKMCYEATLLLKQGLYDYAFCSFDKSSGVRDDEVFEGNFYETGNDYEIFMYLHDSRSPYDRLIGYLPLKN